LARAAAATNGADTREVILATALKTFAERGFDGSSTREIATRAGVNHGLIPYYFGSKPKLWQDAVDRAFSTLGAGLDAILNDPDVADDHQRTRELIRSFVRFVAVNPEFVLLMHDEGKRKGERMRWIVDRHVKPMFETISAFLARAAAKGVLPSDIAPVHFHYILAGAVGVFFHQAEECKRLTGVDPFDPEVVEAHTRAVEYMLLGRAETGASRTQEVSKP
jgi:AcrR family transcriptional regulator